MEDFKVLKVSVNDRATYNVTKRTYTDEGFLSVPGRVARAGIQQYLASELGLTSRDANDIINVYRPEEEVFNTDSLTSYDSCDVTLGHPSEMVNAKNYNQTSVGLVRGSATRDGDFVLANLIIKSKDAVEAVENGTVQLSAGYTAEYHEEKVLLTVVRNTTTFKEILRLTMLQYVQGREPERKRDYMTTTE